MKRMGTWWHVLLRNATCEQSAWGRCCDTVRPGSPHLFLTYSVPAPQGCWGKCCDAGPNPATTCDGRGGCRVTLQIQQPALGMAALLVTFF